mmetsp:Transcript_53797/g.156878  ORF Transcript_53797/g.156878 Transcript_53797/m.156878 type:complete len:236 (-) Transcript_53797:134-841(-)
MSKDKAFTYDHNARRTSAWARKRQDGGQREETKKGSHALPGLVEADEGLLTKSLQMHHDTRFDTMDFYRQHGGTSDDKGHFARMCQTNRKMHGLIEQQKKVSGKDGFDDIAAREVDDETFDGKRILRVAAASVTSRVDWQEAFDKSVKRLFVDFELTQSPGCRLNHLDRMHGWFTEHGAKQTRKDQKGPSYLTADRKAEPLPGSTRNVPSRQGGASSRAFASPFPSPALTVRNNP